MKLIARRRNRQAQAAMGWVMVMGDVEVVDYYDNDACREVLRWCNVDK